MANNDIDESLNISSGLQLIANTPEEKSAARRNVCGAAACHDAADAANIMEALGLIPYRQEQQSA